MRFSFFIVALIWAAVFSFQACEDVTYSNDPPPKDPWDSIRDGGRAAPSPYPELDAVVVPGPITSGGKDTTRRKSDPWDSIHDGRSTNGQYDDPWDSIVSHINYR